MNFLLACKELFRDVFRDRTTTLEQFIKSRNPQTANQVEQLEREYYAKRQRGTMV